MLGRNHLVLLVDGAVLVLDLGLQVLDLLLLFGDDRLEAGDQLLVLGVVLGEALQLAQLPFDIGNAVFNHLHLVQACGPLFQVGAEDGCRTGNLGQFLQDVVHGRSLFDIAVARRFGTDFQFVVGIDDGIVIFFRDRGSRMEFTGGRQNRRHEDYRESSHRKFVFSNRMVVSLRSER